MELSESYKEKLNKLFNIDIDYLSLLKVKYYNFNNEECIGDIVCNKDIYNDLDNIFKTLYENKYQIEKINLIDKYNFNDLLSMEDNNTSCFNYRKIMGTNRLSKHSYGMAIDINPLYNPYVVRGSVFPKNAAQYVDRNKTFPHKIDETDLCYKEFIKHGFKWGGNFTNPDYQHFEK